ncbi:MAG: PP2C family protein-serine/threonine phosphatase [Lachnospiraceae bacterium]|nr:PP2C family protein-serine/threonine phosphatase [Lachnospiraceae bacterium]
MDKVDDFYLIYSPIERANWVLCVYVPEEIIMQPIRQLEQRIKVVITIFVLIMLIVCSIAYFVVKIVSGKIIESILLLKEDVGVISKGNLEHKARVIGNDEVSDLAQAFNDMTKSLKDYISDLTSLTAEKERIGAELNVATSIQSSMLPSIFPNFAGSDKFDIYATMNPAKEVGGDFYDFFMIDDKHIVIVVADVSGKGVPAALFMVIGKTLIKDHTGLKTNLSDVFYEVNNLLCESNSENLFITAFEAVINLETGHLTYVNAGHEMPYIYRKGKGWQPEQMKPGFVLAGMENMKFTTGELYLKPGDKVFQYTDGVTEATNAKNELYGMDRLKEALDANSDKKMFDLLPAVKADIDKFVGEAPQFDDITMLGFEFK